jgi:hypothetical protein
MIEEHVDYIAVSFLPTGKKHHRNIFREHFKCNWWTLAGLHVNVTFEM